MRKHSLFNAVSLFDTSLSAAEYAWRISTVLLIGGSGTIGAFIARADPFFNQLGPIYWLVVGILTAISTSVVIYLVKAANLKQSLAELHTALATPRNTINPLATSFHDVIVPFEDMRLPTLQLHENKHFKRCKFVGPAALAIQGGTYVDSTFNDCGDIIALPDGAILTGIIVFRNCIVEDCEFIRVTIFTDQVTARGFAGIPGATVRGGL